MLAKKKAERQQAITATAATERKEEVLRMKRMREKRGTGASDTEYNGGQKKAKVVKRHLASSQQEQSLDPTLLLEEDPTKMLYAIGDHVNTRLKELEFDDDLDADLADEQQRKLREEAELAACTKSRALASLVAVFLRQQQQQKSHDATTDVSSSTAATGVRMVRIGHNSNAVTAVCSLGCDVVVFGDKSGAVYVADMCREFFSTQVSPTLSRKSLLSPYLPAAVLAIAVSDTRGIRPSQRAFFERTTADTSVTSYIAAGAADGTISVWVTSTRKHMGFLTMHYAAVTGLAFRHDTLYSCSRDGTLRVWSVPQMICQDKLFGHQGHVLSIHCLRRERCATVGVDGTMRFWKVDAATQQEFTTSSHFGVKVVLECVTMMNDSVVLCGATNGALLVFDVNRRKPLVVRDAAHGYGFAGDGTGLEGVALAAKVESEKKRENGIDKKKNSGFEEWPRNANPITAVASIPYSDVAASASYDGVVHLWRLVTPDTTKKCGFSTSQPSPSVDNNDTATLSTKATFDCFASIPINAIVTSLYFPPSSNVLIVGCGKEPRLGRWVVQRHALNAAYVVPLDDGALRIFASCGDVEHIPTALYGFAEEENEAESGGEENASEDANSAGSEDGGSCQDGDVHGDCNGETSLFTVGEDGQMQFSLLPGGGDVGDGVPSNATKKKGKQTKTTKSSATVTEKGSKIKKKTKGKELTNVARKKMSKVKGFKTHKKKGG